MSRGKREERFERAGGWLCLAEGSVDESGEFVPFKTLRLVETPFEVLGQVHLNGEGWRIRCVGLTPCGRRREWFVPREATGEELLKLLASRGAKTGTRRGVGQALLDFMREELRSC